MALRRCLKMRVDIFAALVAIPVVSAALDSWTTLQLVRRQANSPIAPSMMLAVRDFMECSRACASAGPSCRSFYSYGAQCALYDQAVDAAAAVQAPGDLYIRGKTKTLIRVPQSKAGICF